MIALAAIALLQGSAVASLQDELRSADSATAVLQRRCDQPIRALVRRDIHRPASPAQRVRLGVSPREPVRYRAVRLVCGQQLLSTAENWYVPARLTPQMRAALRRDTPFGVVIRPLRPTRVNLSTNSEWSGRRVGEILLHRSVVRSGSGVPLAEVSETYQAAAARDPR